MRKWLPLLLALMLCLVCTAAMAECEHVSQPGNDELVPNTDGTHSHVCTICGTDNGKEECADSCDDDDTACDWCGSTYVAANNYHFDDPTCKVEGGKHVVTCGCGVVVGTYDPKPLYPIDDMFHAVGCDYCLGANGEKEPHVGMGTGTDNGDGTCTYTCTACDYTHEGKHAGGMGIGDGFHGECCNTCSAWVWKEDCSEKCTDQDGECDTCGSSDLTVIHGETTSTISGDKCNHVCNDCGETLESYDLDWIPEETRPSGMTGHFSECPECGKTGAGEVPHTYKYTTTADTHTAECTVCGWAEEAAAHTIESGICSVCGYSDACAHEKTTLMPDPNAWGGHVWLCDACGEITAASGCEFEYVLVDADTHMEVCKVCGCETTPQQHGPYVCEANGANHDVLCYVCNGKVATSTVKYIAVGDYANPQHQAQCDYCLQSMNYTPKTEACTPVGVYVDENSCTYICTICGHDWAGGGHFTQAVDNGNGTHDIACIHCGYVTYDDEVCFESSCANYDGKCDVCGGANPADFYHEDSECTPNGDGTHSILCTTCGTDLNGGPGACFDSCTAPDGMCDWCGGSNAPVEHYYNENYICEDCGHVGCPHETLTCSGTGAVHTATCVDCGAVVGDYPVETSPWTWLEHGIGCGICAMNGTMVTEPCTITNKSTADVCSYVCTVCNYDWSSWNDGKHSFGDYTYTNDDHTTECISCGYAVTEAHVYADDQDNDCDVCGKTKKCQHTYWYKVSKQATCTDDGIRVDYCNLCGKEHGTQTIPAKGHDLSTQDMGDYILESCSRCDYENKIEKAPAEEAPAEEAPVTDGLQIAEADENVTLPETVTAAKTFTVTLMKEGQAVQPEAATTVTLTLTEEELTAINGLKLVLVQADGTLVEIPYEVIDGQIVFTAETLGAFAFVAK